MTTRYTPPEHTAASQSVKKKNKKKKKRTKADSEICLITLPCDKTHSFWSLLTPHLPGAESSKAFSRADLLWQTIKETCSRMLRQTRRKTITIKGARTFPEQKFEGTAFASAATDNKDADRSPNFNGWILLALQTGYIKKFLKKDKEDLAKSSY